MQYNFFRSVLNHRNTSVVILKVLSHPLAKPYVISRQAFVSRPPHTSVDDIVASLLVTSPGTLSYLCVYVCINHLI
jgi:hypothetical protein